MKVECELKDVFEATMRKLQTTGLLLTSVGSDGKTNVMTIGWGLVGKLWRETVFMVAVRPSRYTSKLIEETKEFTVNVPAEGMEETVAYCGKVSGREHDKFKERDLKIIDGISVKAPIIEDCVAHFECKVVGKYILTPEMLSEDVLKTSYPAGNYSTLFFGKILSILGNK